MKMNKKIIVSTLALAMGAALAGSVSGTVAWFQYSTRAQAAYIGATAHCSESLEMTKGDVTASSVWKSEFASSEIENNTNKKIVPITTGKLANNAKLPTITEGTNAGKPEFYMNPLYQVKEYAKWGKATEANYVQFDLHFHVKDIDGKDTVKYLQKDLYLTDLTIKAKQAGESTELDLYKAVRVHFATNEQTPSYNLFASDKDTAATAAISTNVYGNLDLNNDGVYDLEQGYEWDFDDQNTRDVLVYGDENQVQAAKNAAYVAETGTVLANDSDPYNIVPNQGKIGTIKNQEDGLKVTVTIWIEGWQKLGKAPAQNKDKDATGSAIWDAKTYLEKYFQVGMRFAVAAHDNANE